MKTTTVLLPLPLALLLITTSAFSRQTTIVSFFPHADSVCDFPSTDKPLSMLCQKKMDKRYVSFVSTKGEQKAIIVAVTLVPLDDPQKLVSRTVEFDGIHPGVGKISTWGYIYDRNGDAKVDYMALVGGAASFEGLTFPDSFPKRGQSMSPDQMEYFVGHAKLVFNYWADDNGDGALDAVIHIDMDPARDLVRRRIVVRSTHSDGKYDEVWSFRGNLDTGHDSVAHSLRSVPYHPIGRGRDNITKKTFAEKSEILRLINRAAEQCHLTRENFAGSD